MSLWGTHFAVGASCTAVAVSAVAPDLRGRYVVIVLGGFWAIVPDVHWIVPVLRPVTKPVIHDSPLADLFWFHGTLDAWDAGDSAVLSGGSMLGLVVVLLGLELGRRARDNTDTAGTDRAD